MVSFLPNILLAPCFSVFLLSNPFVYSCPVLNAADWAERLEGQFEMRGSLVYA